MRIALLIEVDGPHGAASGISFDAMHIRIGTNFAAAGAFRRPDGGSERAGFCANLAAKEKTEATIDAGASSGARLRKNRHWRWERMPAELARGALENHTGRLHRQWRHGIGLRTRRIERAGAGQARDTDFPFDFRVVRLEVRVGDRPIREAGAGNRANLASLNEIDFVEAPEIRGEVHAGSANTPPVNKRALGLAFSSGVLRKVFCWSFGWLVS